MDLQVKKLKVDIYTTPKQNSLHGPYHLPQGRDKLLIPSVKGEDYDYCLKSMFLKYLTEECTFCWKVLFGEFEQKPGGYNY